MALTLDRLSIVDLRNIAHAELEPARHLNVIAGNNGHGKTSILEAIYLAATSKSFRTNKLGEAVRHGRDASIASARFVEHWQHGPLARQQGARIDRRGKRDLSLDGEQPASLTHFATRSPVVVFEPKQLSLSSGPASERRTLLDRITLFASPEIGAHRARYAKALRERQQLLSDRHGDRRAELEVYESLLAEHGAAITCARSHAVDGLREPLVSAFARIATPGLSLSVRYLPGGSADPAEMARRLADDRPSDARRKRTGFGPHRDDIELTLDGHDARMVASQGQHRALTLALKSAELASIARARSLLPVLLLDDVSSELDAERTAALFEHLAATESQIFLTTTRPELLAGARSAGRADFVVEHGIIEAF